MSTLLSGLAFMEQALRGVAWRRSYEVYAEAGSGSCGVLSQGDPLDGTPYPLLVASVRVPGLPSPYRVDCVWLRPAAPLQFQVTIPVSILNLPFTVGESSLVLSVVMADTAGNSVELIRDGQILITEGGL